MAEITEIVFLGHLFLKGAVTGVLFIIASILINQLTNRLP